MRAEQGLSGVLLCLAIFFVAVSFYPAQAFAQSSQLVATGDRLFIADRGIVYVIDMKNMSVIGQVDIFQEVDGVGQEDLRLFTDHGRVFVGALFFPKPKVIMVYSDASGKSKIIDGQSAPKIINYIFEISMTGNILSKKEVFGSIHALDSDYFYLSNNVQIENKIIYEQLRLDRKTGEYINGNFSENSKLLVCTSATDGEFDWFICSKSSNPYDPKNGFSLVRKSKNNGVDIFPFEAGVKWKEAQITVDRDTVWVLLLDYTQKNENDLIIFEKRSKNFTITPYHGAVELLQNMDLGFLSPETLVVHESLHVYPLTGCAVREEQTLWPNLLLVAKSGPYFPNQHGAWKAHSRRSVPGTISEAPRSEPNERSGAIEKKVDGGNIIFFDRSGIYGDQLWLTASAATSVEKFRIIKVPFSSAPIASVAVKKTATVTIGERVQIFFELIACMIFGT